MTESFCFRATEVFGLFGRGLVFRGRVVLGEIQVGALVAVAGNGGKHVARVEAIECNRQLHKTTRPGVELGLLLNGFKDRAVSAAIEAENVDGLPTPEELLGLQLPVDIVGEA